MTANSIQVSYLSFSVSFTDFSDDSLPRSILEQASLEFSGLGAPYASGVAKRQRRIWSIAAFGQISQWNALMNIFEKWDNDRVTGSNIAEVTIVDNLLGTPVAAYGFFTSAPTISKVAPGNNKVFLMAFGITET